MTAPRKRQVTTDTFERDDENPLSSTNGWEVVNVRLINGMIVTASSAPGVGLITALANRPLDNGQMVTAMVTGDREPSHVGIAARIVTGPQRLGGYLVSLHYLQGGLRALILEKYDSNHPGVRRTLATTQVTLTKKQGTDFGVFQSLRMTVTDTEEGVLINVYLNNDQDSQPTATFTDLGQTAGGAASYEPPGEGGPQTVPAIDAIPVSLVNPTSGYARQDVVTVGVAFHQGEVRDASQAFSVAGARERTDEVQWKPFGARYPDGTIRFAEMTFPVTWDAHEPDGEKIATIYPLREPNPAPWTMTEQTFNMLQQTVFRYQMTENGDTGPTFHTVTTGDSNFTEIDGGYATAHRKRLRHFSRLAGDKSMFWLEIVIDLYSGMNHGQLWVRAGKSFAALTTDPEYSPGGRRADADTDPLGDYTTELETTPVNSTPDPHDNAVIFTIGGCEAYMRFESNRVHWSGRQTDSLGYRVTRWVLQEPQAHTGSGTQYWGHGMCHAVKAALVFDHAYEDPQHAAEFRDDTWAIAMDWPAKGGVPSFFNVPDFPYYIKRPVGNPNEPESRIELVRRINNWAAQYEGVPAQNDPFFVGDITAHRNPPGTGNQGLAFGSQGVWHMMRAGYAQGLRVIERDVRQEFLRPNTYMTKTGGIFTESAFPNTPIYENNLYDNGADLLGLRAPGRGTQPYGWFSQDRGHYSLINEGMVAFLTRDYLMCQYMDQMTELWKAGQVTDKWGGFIPLVLVDSRGYGRGQMMVGTMLAWWSGDQRVRELVEMRVRLIEEDVPPHISELYWGQSANNADNIIGLRYGDPHLTSSSALRTENFLSWDTGEAISGLWAASILLGDTSTWGSVARRIAGELAGTITQYFYQDWRTDQQIIYVRQNTDGSYLDVEWRGLAGFSNYHGEVATGTDSGATGEVLMIDNNHLDSPLLRVYLTNCSGPFLDGEEVTFSGSGATANQITTQPRFVTCTAHATNNHVALTQNQYDESITTQIRTAAITDAPPADPTIITMASTDGYNVGDLVNVSGVTGNTGANGDWVVTAKDATHLTFGALDTSGGSAYAGGGAAAIYEWTFRYVLYSPAYYEVVHLRAAVLANYLAGQGFYGSIPGHTDAIIQNRSLAIYDSISENFNHANTFSWNVFEEHFSIIPATPVSGGIDPPDDPADMDVDTLSTTELIFSVDVDLEKADYTWIYVMETGGTVELEWKRIDHTGPQPSSTINGVLGGLAVDTSYDVRARSFNLGGPSGFSNTDTASTLEDTGGGGGTRPIELVPPHRAVGTWGFFLSGEGAYIDFFEALDRFELRSKNKEAGKTLKELREATLRLIDRTTSSNYPPETVDQFIKDSVDSLLIELGDLGLFARVEENLDLEADVTGRIWMPRNCERVESIRRPVDGCKLEFTYRDMDAEGLVSVQIKGRPWAFAETLRVTYFRRPDEMIDDADRTMVPNRIDEAVIVGAARRIAEQDSDGSRQAALTQRYAETIAAAKKHLSRLYRQSNERITTTGIYTTNQRIVR